MRRRNVQQRIGNLGARWIVGDQQTLRGDRRAIVLAGVLRVADPILRGRRERALRIIFDEAREIRDGPAIIAALELVERGVVRALLHGRVARRSHRRRSATRRNVRRRERRSVARDRTRRRRPFSPCLRRAFELAQPRIEIDVEIALALLRLLELVGQHFLLAAQARDVRSDLLDLVEEIDEPLTLDQ